ncbi:fasciclin-like arabinogalactan protein 12 [Macadamia integrifolia]|uniref:fasciclin-like arabinogalactan protein 12 n=1 Tax=Macadamia integrifolia TaxID=60698 RepID=UPI001C4E6274|nr:fasciclin-like arabinogalactan protein 12 [Macadamia integrifolia]
MMTLKLKQLLLSLTLLFTTTLAQTTPATAPAPSGPTNITAILEKAGQYNIFIKLLRSTQVENQINTQLNNSNQGLTLFAPPDNAFSNLKAGILNSLSDEQKVELVQFHTLPSYVPLSSFQTVSNPIRTQAGNSNNGQFPLNVTTSGSNVNITTGVVNTTVANTIYTDGQLAVYQVDQVLLPLDFFTTPAPAPAPTPAKKKKTHAFAPTTTADTTADSSNAVRIITKFSTGVSFGVVLVMVAAIGL